jgi:hypothetical protein
VPLYLLHTFEGSRRNFGVSIPNSFETMQANTYFHAQVQTVFTRFTFKAIDWKFNKSSRPRIGMHHAYGRGYKTNTEGHNLSFLQQYLGYGETGIYILDLLKNAGGGVGLGVYYHYKGDLFPERKDNFVVKITVSQLF